MGYRNVEAFFRQYSELLRDQHMPFRIGVYMAACARDQDEKGRPARLYHGGWAALAANALGRDLVTDRKGWPAPDAKTHTALKRAMRVLREVGYLEVVAEAHPGQPAMYRLMLSKESFEGSLTDIRPVDNSRLGVGQRPPKANGDATSQDEMGVAELPEWGSLSYPNGGRSATPLQGIHEIQGNSPRSSLNSPAVNLPVENPEEEMKYQADDLDTIVSAYAEDGITIDHEEAAHVLKIARAQTDTETTPMNRLRKAARFRSKCLNIARAAPPAEVPAWVDEAKEAGTARCEHSLSGLAPRSADGKPRCDECRGAGKPAITEKGSAA